jgi:hypothetical protein
MDADERMIAVCGLDCTDCDMREATTNPELQRQHAEWFKRERGIDVEPEDIRCMGCKGDREMHRSPDCWILLCCVDRRGLDFCSECDEFPCSRLEEWAQGRGRYGAALDRLRTMTHTREGTGGFA